jgi:DNA-binding transcriptional ArsR family regulator
MLQQSPALDRIFHALADPTRRAIVDRLATGAATVSTLAEPFEVSLTSIGQHLKILEDCGLVRSSKEGRVRTVELSPATLAVAERWFARHRARWERRLDRLGELLDEEEDDDENTPNTPKKRKP